jgi:hypothetical protein
MILGDLFTSIKVSILKYENPSLIIGRDSFVGGVAEEPTTSEIKEMLVLSFFFLNIVHLLGTMGQLVRTTPLCPTLELFFWEEALTVSAFNADIGTCCKSTGEQSSHAKKSLSG